MHMSNVPKVKKLGQRWVCYECAARFYDLNRPEPLCPKCKADQRESPAYAKPKPKRGRRKKAAPAPPAELVEEPLVIAEAPHPMDQDLDEEPGLIDEDRDPDDAPFEDEFERV